MAEYTTQVRTICESLAGLTESTGFDDIDDIIEDALPHIFDFEFPIFDEAYRSVLETKIIRHFYTREIGLETYGLWKLKLCTKLNEIMPYYNKLYNSELYTYNPLYDVNMTTTNVGQKTGETTDINSSKLSGEHSRQNENNTVGSTESIGDRNTVDRNLYSDTPQGALTGVDQENYLTNVRKIVGIDATTEKGNSTATSLDKQTGSDNQASNSTNLGKSKNTEDYVMHVIGKTAGSDYAKMIKGFRDNLLNIDMDIIRDLEPLFMLIW